MECSVLSSPVLAIHAVNVGGRITLATRPNRRIQFLPQHRAAHEPHPGPARALAWLRPSLGSDFSIHPAPGPAVAGVPAASPGEPGTRNGGRGRRRNGRTESEVRIVRETRAERAGSAGEIEHPTRRRTPPDLLELTDRALTRLITFISYATTLDCRTRLRTSATLCMPGHPPHHVCASMRRILLTYLLQVQSPHSRPRLRHVHMYGVTLSAPHTAMP